MGGVMEQTAETIQARLSDPAEEVRLGALGDLMKPDAEPAHFVDGVAACLDHSSEAVRQLAVVVLGQVAALGEDGKPAVPGLVRALDEAQPKSVRALAATGLARAGPAASSAIEPLCRMLTVPDKTLRSQASLALGKIGAPAVPWLRRVLRVSDPAVIVAAADALGLVGRPAKDAVEDLRSLQASADPNVQKACESAQEKIGGQTAAG
jgi:HEAT repeat protein